MNREKLIDRTMIVAVVIMVVLLCASTWAHASGDRITQSNDPVTSQTVATSIGGNDTTAIGFAAPSFTAAIDQCLASKGQSWLWGLWANQDSESNFWCMGAQFFQLGKYDAAARVWCDRAGMTSLYSTRTECIDDLSAPPERPVETPEPVVEETQDHLYMAQIEELTEKFNELAASKPETIQRTIVREAPKLTEEQRQAFVEFKVQEFEK